LFFLVAMNTTCFTFQQFACFSLRPIILALPANGSCRGRANMHNQHLVHKSLTMRITSAGLALLAVLLIQPTFAAAQAEPVNLSIL
jgi:hypothetical protein